VNNYFVNSGGKPICQSKILFLGIAYKEDVPDIRESGALKLIKILQQLGPVIEYWDPVYSKQYTKENEGDRPIYIGFTNHEHIKLPDYIKDNTNGNGIDRNPIEEMEGAGEKGDFPGTARRWALRILPIVAETSEWDDIKKILEEGRYDCVVIATNHEEFSSFYTHFLFDQNRKFPVVDLRNALTSWVHKICNYNEKGGNEEAKKLMLKLDKEYPGITGTGGEDLQEQCKNFKKNAKKNIRKRRKEKLYFLLGRD